MPQENNETRNYYSKFMMNIPIVTLNVIVQHRYFGFAPRPHFIQVMSMKNIVVAICFKRNKEKRSTYTMECSNDKNLYCQLAQKQKTTKDASCPMHHRRWNVIFARTIKKNSSIKENRNLQKQCIVCKKKLPALNLHQTLHNQREQTTEQQYYLQQILSSITLQGEQRMQTL